MYEKTATDSRSQSESQPRNESDLQGSRDPSQLWGRSVARLLRGLAGERSEARDGAPDLSPKDRRHCFDTLEEGGTFRRRTTEATSSLSVAQNSGDLPGLHARWWPIGSSDARVRGRVSMHSLGAPCAAVQHRVSGSILCPL